MDDFCFCPYINDLIYSCYSVMQQAYSMDSILVNGELLISTGQKKWCKHI